MAANESANKAYYASGNKSAIRRASPVVRKGRLDDPIQANASPVHIPGDTSTDQYYRSGGSSMQQRAAKAPPMVPVDPKADSKARPAAGRGYGTTLERDLRRPLIVRDRKQVRDAVQKIVDALNAGTTPVLVQVPKNSSIEADVRTGLDIQVAREQITRDQYRDVNFALIPDDGTALADQVFGKIDKNALPEVKIGTDPEDVLPDDFGAFVKEENNDAPVETSRVTSVSGGSAVVQAPAGDDTDDDVPDTEVPFEHTEVEAQPDIVNTIVDNAVADGVDVAALSGTDAGAPLGEPTGPQGEPGVDTSSDAEPETDDEATTASATNKPAKPKSAKKTGKK